MIPINTKKKKMIKMTFKNPKNLTFKIQKFLIKTKKMDFNKAIPPH